MKQFLSKRSNLLASVTFIFVLIFILITFVIPTFIYRNNLNTLKDHLQELTRNYESITEVESTERLYVYEDGNSEMLIDAGTIYDIDTDIEVHLIHWSHDQTVPEQFYEDDFQARNFVYYIRIIEDEHYVIAFSDTSEMLELVSNFRLYSIIIVSVLFVATLIFTSTYLSNRLIKKYSFYDPSSELNSKIAFLHNFDKKQLSQYQITYHQIYNVDDIIDKYGHTNSNEIHQRIKQKLLQAYSFEDVYQLSDSEFITLHSMKEEAHLYFYSAVNATLKNQDIIPYEFKIKTVLVNQEIVLTMDAKTLINRFQYALHHSKSDNKDITFVDQELLDLINEELYYQSRLHDAIDHNLLVNYYQIKVNPNSNKVIGAEALSRWIEEDRVVSPSKYIHLAEASGLIYNIDLISFENTCKTVTALREQDMITEEFRLSTNFSPLTLKNVSIETIKEIIERTNASPSHISIEVTESVSLEFNKIKDILDQFVDIGIHIEIDDFSAGNSSFSVLPFINASTLKLDMAVLPNNIESKNEILIYDSLLSISKQLHMKIISEGVESQDQVDYLKTREIDGIQGYYYSRPIPFDAFLKLLQQYK